MFLENKGGKLMGQEFMTKIAEAVNIIGNFCGPRDIDELTAAALQDKYNIVWWQYTGRR